MDGKVNHKSAQFYGPFRTVCCRIKEKTARRGAFGENTIDNYFLLGYNLNKEAEQKQRGEVP